MLRFGTDNHHPMSRRLASAAAALAFALPVPTIAAQSVGHMMAADARDAGGDVVALWESPLHGSPRDWLIALGTVGAGAALSPLDDDVDRFVVRHRDSPAFRRIEWFREGGPLFSGKYVAPPVVALYAVGLATRNRGIRDGTFGCVAAYTGTSVVRNYVLYNLVSRRRPDSTRHHEVEVPAAAPGDQYAIHLGPSDWGHHAFPGGHVANMAACASFLSHRFRTGAVTPLLYAVVGTIGAGRMIDRRHWASDTFVGIVFGYASGRLAAQRSRERLDRSAPIAPPPPLMNEGLNLMKARGRFTVAYARTF